ncbi:MAG TPA: hypothetical protein VF132_03260 [Rudaea sp.]
MSAIFRATKDGFMDSIGLAGALLLAVGSGIRAVADVLVAFMHHETLIPRRNARRPD